RPELQPHLGEHVCIAELISVQKTMNNSFCPPVSFSFSGKFLPPVYILVFFIGLAANGWGLRSLLKNWKKLGNISIFVLNLGISDVLYLLTVPFLTFCKITRFCFNLNLYGSIGFLTCISVYRYLAIVHPMRAMGRITFTHSVIISVTTWLLVGIQCLPDMFYTKTSKRNTEKCFDTTDDEYVESYLKYSLGWTFMGFCIPLLITLGCYGHVLVVLCRKNTTDKVLRQRCMNLWSRLLFIWKVCQKWSNGVYIARQLSRGLVCLNSALNPLVYLRGDETSWLLSENVCSQLRNLPHRQQPFLLEVLLHQPSDTSLFFMCICCFISLVLSSVILR
uniref:Si:dkey-78k11.9 n=1 Tax=Takifugu rubripes TaxID=31033 RepID=A0A674P5P8_TAKRU